MDAEPAGDPADGITPLIVGAGGIGLTTTNDDIGVEVVDPLFAVIVKVYVPFVNPDTKIGLDKLIVIILPGDEVTL